MITSIWRNPGVFLNEETKRTENMSAQKLVREFLFLAARFIGAKGRKGSAVRRQTDTQAKRGRPHQGRGSGAREREVPTCAPHGGTQDAASAEDARVARHKVPGSVRNGEPGGRWRAGGCGGSGTWRPGVGEG